MKINISEELFLRCYPIWVEWNHRKSIKNFIKVYRFTFTRYTLKENPFWRIYKIIKSTHNGQYKKIEKDFREEYRKLKDNKNY